MSNIHKTIEAVWKIESTRLIAAIARVTRDIGIAEELAQDALVTALEVWPEEGIPDNPGAWLMTAAKNSAKDARRRRAVAEAKAPLLVEDDIDITDLTEVVWAFATRSHPERGEFHFPNELSDQLAIYLSEQEQHSFKAGKVIYNCLLADLFPAGQRPVKGSFENGWPAHIQQRVLTRWNTYGYR